MPAAVVVVSNIVGVDHEGRDGVTIFKLSTVFPLIVLLSNGLADGDRGLCTGAGCTAFSDQSLDIGGAVNTVEQSLGAGCIDCCCSTKSRRVVAAEDAHWGDL